MLLNFRCASDLVWKLEVTHIKHELALSVWEGLFSAPPGSADLFHCTPYCKHRHLISHLLQLKRLIAKTFFARGPHKVT